MIPIPIPGFSDPVSSLTHLLAAFAALFGAGFLLAKGRGNGPRVFSLMVFSFTLVFLFSMSGVFHLLDRGSQGRDVLQRLDHAGIWLLIAGTFTPMQVILFRGFWRWSILILVWTLAITALVLEVIFFHSFPEALLLSMFLGLGWLGAISGYVFRRSFGDPSIKYLAAGGMFYSIGAVFDFLHWPVLIDGVFGPHEVFHIFVILGALSHWIFIYRWSHHPVVNDILVHVHIFPDSRFVARAVGERIMLETRSLDEMKTLIKADVARKFHSTIQPTIRLRYFQEENI
jgi:channel protein (hemolysin III family)